MIAWQKTNGFTELSEVYDLTGGQEGSWNLIAELDGNNDVVRSYMWGKDLSGTLNGAGLPAASPACAGTADRDAAQAGGVGGLLGVNDADQGFHFVAYDGNGNVMALVDADDRTISAEYEYGPFGELIRSTIPMSDNPIRFSTKYHDTETGLVYYGYRYYSPSLGRWMSRDHIGERGGVNLYGFVYNNSVCNYDPVGLSLGSDITRIFVSRVLMPNLNVFRANHYDLFDDDNEMASDLSAQLSEFYRKFLCSKLSDAKSSWRSLSIPEMNAPQYMGEAFYVTEGLKGWWLSGSYHVDIRGGLEFRCAANNCLQYRKLDVVGKWHDDIDANSFPGIAGWKGETKDVFDNEAPWLAAVIEGIWDILGDGIADTDFEVTVTFT
ncbi:MAG: RHS repeat-associated core domain-containing protein, partial [Verrucomicrobia bacterium]|nr:RHS repeat-associated core domain-containing protein [Verrucomicrobiota bacterium]